MADALHLRPLTARSVVLSTLLGSHPPRLKARHLVRVGELFGIAEGTVRVALSRMVAAGDLVQTEGSYELAARLLRRQARQDDSLAPRHRPWDGSWEIAVVTAEGRRPAAERAALRQAMSALRLAELREGTWVRPANLDRPRPEVVRSRCAFFEGRPEGDPAELAAALWDLDGWVSYADALLAADDPAAPMAERFTLSAAVLRHLLADPLLPAGLLTPRRTPRRTPLRTPQTPRWPGPDLRRLYERFESDLTALLALHIPTG